MHVYTSPHLVRFNERIRVAGELVSDDALAAALEEVERVNAGAPITVFEVITAVAFLLFAATPADLCVLEVGLGGRGDATNVIDRPAACAITSISLDHRELLGDTLDMIAAEKAGIMKPGVPVAIGAQPPDVLRVLLADGRSASARRLLLRGRDWHVHAARRGLPLQRRTRSLILPPPSLPGLHQLDNAGIAIAALRAAGLGLPDRAFVTGIAHAEWPARLQRLHGRLAKMLPPDWELWLDGGHNPGAGVVLADHIADWPDRPVHLIVGMKQAKDSAEFLRPLLPLAAAAVGGGRAGPASRVAGGGDHRRLRRRGAARPDRRRCTARRSARSRPGARADLRQPVSGRRGAEARCVVSWLHSGACCCVAPHRRRHGGITRSSSGNRAIRRSLRR